MLVAPAIDEVLVGLDYLHDAEVVHTGEPCNYLISYNNDTCQA